MFGDKRVVVVMPAYNAGITLRRTWDEVMATGIVDHVVVVDDASRDDTVAVARTLPHTEVHVHARNRGYGANQKTCYARALAAGADVVAMVHPDHQYTPRLLPALVGCVASGLYGVALGSRLLGGGARRGGMPWWKYLGNRALTVAQNRLAGATLAEWHTGYRVFARDVLEQLPLAANADDFVFDAEILLQVLWGGWRIAEVTCPTRYAPDASSIDFARSVRYGLGCLRAASEYAVARAGLRPSARFPRHGYDRDPVPVPIPARPGVVPSEALPL